LLFQLGSRENELISVALIDSAGQIVIALSQTGNILVYDVSHLVDEYFESLVHTTIQMEKTIPTAKLINTTDKKDKGVFSIISLSHPAITALEANISLGKVSLNLSKMKGILESFGEYPAKYRCIYNFTVHIIIVSILYSSLIWRSILQLPENHTSFSALLEKGTHPAFENISSRYPIKSQKLSRILQRTLSVLGHWTSLFAEIEFLPALVFPFVKQFQNNQLILFEIVATILFNWCSQWFQYFPNPPLNILSMIENVLSYHDSHLLEHFINLKITSHIYSWPLLQTLFSEVLSKDEWLKLWDNVISQPMSFLLMVVVSYISSARQTLLKCTTTEDVKVLLECNVCISLYCSIL
jgi:hypothetical protein